MSDFYKFKEALQKQFKMMSQHDLFVTCTDKYELWDTYLDSFPEGTNNIYKERGEYDCQCCRQFIRAVGNMVAIFDNQLISLWDVDVDGYYQEVTDKMSDYIKSKDVKDVFLHYEKKAGTDFNHQMLENNETIKWQHFYLELPNKFVNTNDGIGTVLSNKRSNKEVLKRSFEEITLDSAEVVLELIDQNSLYRGEEHRKTVEMFIKHKTEYMNLPTDELDNYCWVTSGKLNTGSRIRNTVIGTLLTDISEGKSLNDAVKMFESKVAPSNYKRPTALITQSMIKNAQKKIIELGIENPDEDLKRRYAITDDITINNVLFADRSSKKTMNVFDEMVKETKTDMKKLDKIEEVHIDKFIKDVVPNATTIEVMVENNHTNNFMSLIAPVNNDSKNILKWNNNFSWAYNGEVADSMKDRVKAKGGKVDGVLRFSIQWNEEGNNNIDFDAHCIEPNRNLISFPKKGQKQPSTGMLDVDIMGTGSRIAVENITWTNKTKMQKGRYKFIVHNFSSFTSRAGFTAEIEYDGQIYSYTYDKKLKGNQKITVAEIDFSRADGIKFVNSLPSQSTTKEIWNISTNNFRNVSMIMNSPNHWDGNEIGNKHHFFILEDCKNDKPSRGFFNEFLSNDLTEHRKVFEVLGSKMKTETSDNQLSGVGFSSTQRNSIICKVTGKFKRTIKIIF